MIKRQHQNHYHVIQCRVATLLFPLSASRQNEAVFAISESHVVGVGNLIDIVRYMSSVLGALLMSKIITYIDLFVGL